MPETQKDSITSLRISLRVDGDPHFLILLTSEGHVKRMGYSALSRREDAVATGQLPGALPDVLEEMPAALLNRAGVYEDPGREGDRCQWLVEFDGQSGPVRFDLSYWSRSAGLPSAIGQLVKRAEDVTEPLYRQHLEASGASPASVDEAVTPFSTAVAPDARAAYSAPPVRTGDIREYLSFEGRIGRVNYLLHYVLPMTALGFAGTVADGVMGMGTVEQVGPMGIVAALISIWPGMAGWAKRLHDFDMSLWIVPKVLVGGAVGIGVALALNAALGLVAMGVWGIAVAVLVIASYLRPGTPGPNQYGPDPRTLPVV